MADQGKKEFDDIVNGMEGAVLDKQTNSAFDYFSKYWWHFRYRGGFHTQEAALGICIYSACQIASVCPENISDDVFEHIIISMRHNYKMVKELRSKHNAKKN